VRIALIVYGSLDVLSGGNLYDRTLVEHLRSNGHEVDVVELSPGSYGRHVLQNLSRSIPKRIASGNYDVVLQDELVHPSLFYLNRVLRHRIDCPLVGIVHHLLSSEPRAARKNAYLSFIEKTYLETVDAFVFNSETTKNSVERVLGRPTANVVATPGGDRFANDASLTRQQLAARAHRDGPIRLLFVGNLIPRKGLHTLVRALSKLENSSWRLDVVGAIDLDTDYAENVLSAIARHNLSDRITLHGKLDGERLAELYRDSQLFVLPSSYEGFGIVYLEAMSFGLPILACDSGATAEIVRHGVTGLLVPPDDAPSLGHRMDELLEDRELVARMSLEARDAFSTHPRWNESMKKIESFLCTYRRA
jgi:glycosyltransferase involved in cell wall biosynthesis